MSFLQVQLDEEEAATLEDVEVAVDEARASQDTDFLSQTFVFLFALFLGSKIKCVCIYTVIILILYIYNIFSKSGKTCLSLPPIRGLGIDTTVYICLI